MTKALSHRKEQHDTLALLLMEQYPASAMRLWHRAHKLLSLYTKSLTPKRHTPLPDWMSRRMEWDIARASHFTASDTSRSDHYLVCTIKGGTLHCRYQWRQCRHFRLHVLLRFLHQLSRRVLLPDVSFAIYYGDFLEKVPSRIGLPTLAFAKPREAEGPILIPDFEMLACCNDLNKACRRYSDALPWEAKEARAFWRGAATGIHPFWQTPRARLAQVSRKAPHPLDAKITAFPQHESVPKGAELLLGNPASIKDHFAYKYLVDVDGNSCAYSRTHWILRSNCLLLKERSSHVQWYYEGLCDGDNVAFFQEDPLEAIGYFQQNDERARHIAERGRLFAERYLTAEYCASYMVGVLKRLKRLY